MAKASLYNVFGSKEGLVAAYLASRHDRTTSRLTRAIERRRSAKKSGRLRRTSPAIPATDFNGCAFVAASTESPQGGLVEHPADQYRA